MAVIRQPTSPIVRLLSPIGSSAQRVSPCFKPMSVGAADLSCVVADEFDLLDCNEALEGGASTRVLPIVFGNNPTASSNPNPLVWVELLSALAGPSVEKVGKKRFESLGWLTVSISEALFSKSRPRPSMSD